VGNKILLYNYTYYEKSSAPSFQNSDPPASLFNEASEKKRKNEKTIFSQRAKH
jgi:hypothetical protein